MNRCCAQTRVQLLCRYGLAEHAPFGVLVIDVVGRRLTLERGLARRVIEPQHALDVLGGSSASTEGARQGPYAPATSARALAARAVEKERLAAHEKARAELHERHDAAGRSSTNDLLQ